MADQGLVKETACAVVDKLKAGDVTPLDLLDVLDTHAAADAVRGFEHLDLRAIF